MNRRTLTAPAVLVALALSLTACGGSKDDSSTGTSSDGTSSGLGVTVTGDFGAKPTIKMDAPVEVKKSDSFVNVKGDGAEVKAGQPYVLNLTMADASSGKTVFSTYDKGQSPMGSSSVQGLTVLADALNGKKAGSRVVVAATAKDSFGDQGNPQLGIKAGDPVILVADLMAAAPTDVLDKPKGSTVKPKSGAPRLLTKKGVPSGFDFASATKPKKLQVIPLIKGTGPKVTSPGVVTVNYLGSVWGSKKVFDASYPRKQTASFPLGVGGVIPGWDKGLVGVPVGSRVLVICPPDFAYGKQGSPGRIPKNATLAFVVDVLGAS